MILNNEVPSPEDFMLKSPLYREYEVSKSSRASILSLRHLTGSVDCFCVACKETSVFVSPNKQHYIEKLGILHILSEEQRESMLADELSDIIRLGTFTIELRCSRNGWHRLLFIFEINSGTIKKIGQSPSLADLQLPEILKFKGVLEENYGRELYKAIGLKAHGVGIGSFVYLRRIFEDLIKDAFKTAKASRSIKITEDKFIKLKMNDKIKKLRPFLPTVLVENADIYSILSLGLHELSEDECLKYFDVIYDGIVLILNEKLAEKERHSKILELKSSLKTIKDEQTK